MGILDIEIDGINSKLASHPTVEKCSVSFLWIDPTKATRKDYKALTKEGAKKLKVTVKHNDDNGELISVGKETVIGGTVIGGKKLVLCVKKKPVEVKEESKKSKKDKEE